MTNTSLSPLFSRFLSPRLVAGLLAAGLTGCVEPGDDLAFEDDVEDAEQAYRVATSPTSTCAPNTGDLVWPISGQPDVVAGTDVIQDVYGAIIRGGNDYNHGGVDFRAPTGTPIHAVADGFVTRKCAVGQASCSGHSGKGNWLLIQHDGAGAGGETLYTVYAHMDSFDTDGMGTELQEGDCVTAGDVVGEVGNTGNANTEHLHFSVHADLNGARSPVNSNSLNPWLMLPDKTSTVDYSASALGPDANGDLHLHVEAEAQYANIARIEAYRLQKIWCFMAPCPMLPIDVRVLEWDGQGVMNCGPSCTDYDISPVDFDPGSYQDPTDPGDAEHIWDFFITPATANAGDEYYRVIDVHGRIVAGGVLD